MTGLSGRRRNILICLCLALATTAVYWPVRRFGFVNFDDPGYIYENPHLRWGLTLRGLGWAFTTPQDQWMPVTWLARLLEYQFFGLGAGAHHLVNVALHIANALLLFSVLNRMTGTPWRSALVAALFAVHPLCVESVAWVTGLKDVLSMWFGLLTIWAYVRYVEQFTVHSSQFTVRGSTLHASRSLVRRSLGEGGKLLTFYGLTLLFFALALMSKPMMVTLPLVLLLLDYWPLGRTQWVKPAPIRSGAASGERAGIPLTRLLKEKLPFFALTVASCVVTYWAQRGLGAVPSLERLPLGMRIANVGVSYLRYLGKIFWPSGLAVFYPYQKWSLTAVVGAGAALIAVSAWVIRRARREPHFIVGWLWFLGTLVPVIGLVQVGNQSLADRYTYLPLIGPFVAVAWCIPSGAVERRAGRVITTATALLLLGVCAVLCRLQVCRWRNSETLFRYALAVTRNNPAAHVNLGTALIDKGRIQEAVEHYEQAVRLKPDYAMAHYNLGFALVLLGRVPEAMSHWEQALRIWPDYADAHNNLGLALWRTGKAEEAIGHYNQALKINPDFAEAHCNLGNALFRQGKVTDAIEHYEQAIQANPDLAEAHYDLGTALEQAGKVTEAIGHYEQAVRLKPDFAAAQHRLARLRTAR